MAATKTARSIVSSQSCSTGGAYNNVSGSLSQTTAYGLSGVARITNGGTGPTIACQFRLDVSNDNTNWRQWMAISAPTTANAVTDIPWSLPPEIMYVQANFGLNTGQTVTVECVAHELTTV